MLGLPFSEAKRRRTGWAGERVGVGKIGRKREGRGSWGRVVEINKFLKGGILRETVANLKATKV